MAIRYRSEGARVPLSKKPFPLVANGDEMIAEWRRDIRNIGALLRIKAAAPIKPRAPQARCDLGLFSDEADQLDLVEMLQDPVED